MKRLILLTASTLVLAATFAIAQNVAPSALAAGDNARALRMAERRLDLTPAQVARAKSILQQERPALQQLHTQLEAEHTAMAAQPAFNEAETRALAAQFAETNTSALVERQKLRSELLAILTPAQQQKLQQMRARFNTRLNERIDARLQTLGDGL